MSDDSPTVGDEIRRIERELNLPEDFYDRLMDEDEWSFVVKMHAYLDGASSRLLTACLGRPELEGVFERMDFANRRSGKLAFLESLHLLSRTSLDYLTVLTELRNRYVHRISISTTTLADNIKTLQPDRIEKLAKSANLPVITGTLSAVKNKEAHDLVLSVFAKRVLWYGAFSVLTEVVEAKYSSERRHKLDGFAYEFFSKIAKGISLKDLPTKSPE